MKILSEAVWRAVESEIAHLRASQIRDRERIDGLMEALARERGQKVTLPVRTPPQVPLEKASGYFDVKHPKPEEPKK